MHKRKKNNINEKYDEHIIEALKKLPKPLKTFDDHNVYFNVDKRKETIFEHIANKKHHLHETDISQIPIILKDIKCLKNDRYGSKFRNYIAKRKKRKEKKKFLKIVTELKKNNNESITTICCVKNNKR